MLNPLDYLLALCMDGRPTELHHMPSALTHRQQLLIDYPILLPHISNHITMLIVCYRLWVMLLSLLFFRVKGNVVMELLRNIGARVSMLCHSVNKSAHKQGINFSVTRG